MGITCFAINTGCIRNMCCNLYGRLCSKTNRNSIQVWFCNITI